MIDFTDSIDASKFEMEASKCKTKEDRIKFCREYLNKSGYIMSYPEKKKDLDSPYPLTYIHPEAKMSSSYDGNSYIPYIINAGTEIVDLFLEDFAKSLNPFQEELKFIHKPVIQKMMDEIVEKGFITITQHRLEHKLSTRFDYKLGVVRIK